MPRGIPNKKVAPQVKQKWPNKRKWTRRQGQTVPAAQNGLSVEPAVPICHIERGSGGDIRYSVRAPGVTMAGAREEAQRQFQMLRDFVESLGKPQQ